MSFQSPSSTCFNFEYHLLGSFVGDKVGYRVGSNVAKIDEMLSVTISSSALKCRCISFLTEECRLNKYKSCDCET